MKNQLSYGKKWTLLNISKFVKLEKPEVFTSLPSLPKSNFVLLGPDRSGSPTSSFLNDDSVNEPPIGGECFCTAGKVLNGILFTFTRSRFIVTKDVKMILPVVSIINLKGFIVKTTITF